MNNILSDETTYEIMNHVPLQKMIKILTSILASWKQREYIDTHTYRRIYYSDGNLPKAYGLPKIHKPNCPLES